MITITSPLIVVHFPAISTEMTPPNAVRNYKITAKRFSTKRFPYVGQVAPLGHIQHQRPGGVRLKYNQVVSICHIRCQRPGCAKMAPNQVVPMWHIRLQRPGGAKIVLAIMALTMSMTEWGQVGTFIWNLHKWVYIIFVSCTSLI